MRIPENIPKMVLISVLPFSSSPFPLSLMVAKFIFVSIDFKTFLSMPDEESFIVSNSFFKIFSIYCLTVMLGCLFENKAAVDGLLTKSAGI